MRRGLVCFSVVRYASERFVCSSFREDRFRVAFFEGTSINCFVKGGFMRAHIGGVMEDV